MTLAALALAGVLLGWWQSRSMRRLAQAPIATVAVADFSCPADSGLGDSFSRGLRRRLAQVPGLAMVPEEAMKAFSGRDLTLDDAALRLGASVLLEGRLEPRAGQWTVSARLTGVARGQTLWSGRIECEGGTPAGCQEPLVRAIAASLGGRPPGGAAPSAVR
jgi:TolB-like protein